MNRVCEETTRRKQQRILQVREQSKEIAARLRSRVNEERERQKEHVERLKIDELHKWRNGRVCEQQQQYDRIIGSTLDANDEARRELEENFLYNQRKKEMDLVAVERGRLALRKELNDRVKKPAKKSQSRSKEVQTDPITPVQCSVIPGAESAKDILPPESAKHDDMPISDRSADILEKSKRFVEDATRRLNEISTKVAQCQAAACEPDKEDPVTPQINEQVPAKKIPSNLKVVRLNHTTRLRSSLPRQSSVQPRIAKRPKKVIPSAAETQPVYSERNSVVCYDHPNRFTKVYDIPKNIVVKTVSANDGDDAVTNAYNETLTQMEEDTAREARSKELRHKETIRELEAIEKSQVRRDYEMLAKTLDELRKTQSSSPPCRQFASGNKSLLRSGSVPSIPVDVENEILHVPIRISCPKVSDQQTAVNVGDPTDREDFSGSDSAQTILLDQLAEQKDPEMIQKQPRREVVLVTENNMANVKVVKGNGKVVDEPVKIIIQVENFHRPEPPLNNVALDAQKSRIYGTVNESLSTNYMSPPSEIETQMCRFLKPQQKKIKRGKEPSTRTPPNLKSYISKLLQMPQIEVERLSENDVSDLPTPTNSIINMNSNVSEPFYNESKLSSISRLIEDNYSILEEVDQLIAQNDLPKDSSSSSKLIRRVGSATTGSTQTILHRYATMSQNYNDRIQSLSKMIRVIRAEKENLLQDNGLSNVTTSERDTSTKYKDFASVGKTISSSGSELSNDSGDNLGALQINQAKTKPVQLDANRVIALSRDSGISMSRPVTSSEIRDNAEDRAFEPMLKDIPKQKPFEGSQVIEMDKKRPPNSISRYSPEAIQAAGHDLSTIIEVDTPGTVNMGPQDAMPGELKKFATIEEFLGQTGNNASLLSEVDGVEVASMKPFVSFAQFLKTNGNASGQSTMNNDMELDLSEIADELRKRSLLAGENNHDKDDDEKKYLRSLSRELEDMIQRINSQGPKEPSAHGISMTSFKSRNSDGGSGNDTTIGLDKITLARFPTREEFNLQNQSKHYQSADVLKSLIEGSIDDTLIKDPGCDARQRPSQRMCKGNVGIADAGNEGSSESSGSGSNKKSPDSLRSQTLNLSDDLMNALENNLSEMGLKWAVNMLKRSHQQLSSRASSSEENLSKDPIPFESKTMSLLTDLEKSSISDESKTSNIKNLILRELIKSRNKSGNSSSAGSLSSSTERRLQNATGSDDGRCLRTSTPVNSNLFSSISTSTIVDRDKTDIVDMSTCLFSGESKLSSVKDYDATLSHQRLSVPGMQLDTRKYARPTDSTLSTEYSLNEHNKRKMTRKINNK